MENQRIEAEGTLKQMDVGFRRQYGTGLALLDGKKRKLPTRSRATPRNSRNCLGKHVRRACHIGVTQVGEAYPRVAMRGAMDSFRTLGSPSGRSPSTERHRPYSRCRKRHRAPVLTPSLRTSPVA